MNATLSKVLQTVLPLVVLVAAGMGAGRLISTRPKPPMKPRAERAVLVEAEPVVRKDADVVVQANGTVTPAYSVEVMSEIGGRVVWKNPQLTIGGQVKKGDLLVRIDPRDYALALSQQRAALERARTEIALEQGRANVAAQEWQQFAAPDAGNPELALRKPQMRAAEIGIESAETSVRQAQLQLGKTTIKAPFDAFVRVNATEVGRLVAPQQSLATLVNTTFFTVVVSLPVDDLQWLKIPGTNAPLLTDEAVEAAYESDDTAEEFAKLGSLALITQEVGSKVIQRPGLAIRLLGELDPVGRMARLLVSVRDPLGRNDPEGGKGAAAGQLPILLGAYVKVELQGKKLEDVIEVPREALRDGDRVYVYADGKLEVRELEIIRRGETRVLVRGGLEQGDMLITTPIASPVPGMDLRLPESADAAPGQTGGDKPELPKAGAAGGPVDGPEKSG